VKQWLAVQVLGGEMTPEMADAVWERLGPRRLPDSPGEIAAEVRDVIAELT
jgi:hypothetical protein